MPFARAACVLVLGSLLSSQTFLVDINNGPGTHYTTIAAAVAAVPNGAVLYVRPGTYGGFAINKTVRILGDFGVALTPGANVTISGLAANQTVVLRHVRASGGGVWSFSNCVGPIFVDRCYQSPQQVQRLGVANCQQVAVRNYGLGASPGNGMFEVTLTNSNVVFEACQIGRGNPTSVTTVNAGITQTGGTLQLVDCEVRGGANPYPNATAGIAVTNGQLRLLGVTTVNGGTNQGRAIVGTGGLRYEPSVVFSGGLPDVPPAMLPTMRTMPRLTTVPNLSGDQYFARLYGPAGHLAAIALALPGPVVQLPGFDDAVWLDPVTVGGLVAAVLTTAPFVWHIQTPAGVPLLGVRATWQGVTYDPVEGFQLSNPSFTILP